MKKTLVYDQHDRQPTRVLVPSHAKTETHGTHRSKRSIEHAVEPTRWDLGPTRWCAPGEKPGDLIFSSEPSEKGLEHPETRHNSTSVLPEATEFRSLEKPISTAHLTPLSTLHSTHQTNNTRLRTHWHLAIQFNHQAPHLTKSVIPLHPPLLSDPHRATAKVALDTAAMSPLRARCDTSPAGSAVMAIMVRTFCGGGSGWCGMMWRWDRVG